MVRSRVKPTEGVRDKADAVFALESIPGLRIPSPSRSPVTNTGGLMLKIASVFFLLFPVFHQFWVQLVMATPPATLRLRHAEVAANVTTSEAANSTRVNGVITT